MASPVTATGNATTTRGAGRPAAAAASRILGTMCSRSVRGPVTHVIWLGVLAIPYFLLDAATFWQIDPFRLDPLRFSRNDCELLL